ncbi:MAG TPA: nuclear transport factor 2 family protein [Microbacterium sp.]|uniref:nuclear transport factor 2 family protein n=1 Tax=Microbacterium sp. TaxID=51671 RepID=UPI002BD8EA3B|nr:nuclear transport factor 2 family protein [Microbacterium sp.]HWI31544.1 nuclear transport factor 2 family protein [Microbacterium sp.]
MDLSLIRAAEQELLTPAVRRNSRRVYELLHPEFIEIGRSGRRWTRNEIVAALADETDRGDPTTDEWQFSALAPNLTLVTYLIRGAGGDSRHSSVWETTDGRLQLRFHQGTPVTDR